MDVKTTGWTGMPEQSVRRAFLSISGSHYLNLGSQHTRWAALNERSGVRNISIVLRDFKEDCRVLWAWGWEQMQVFTWLQGPMTEMIFWCTGLTESREYIPLPAHCDYKWGLLNFHRLVVEVFYVNLVCKICISQCLLPSNYDTTICQFDRSYLWCNPMLLIQVSSQSTWEWLCIQAEIFNALWICSNFLWQWHRGILVSCNGGTFSLLLSVCTYLPSERWRVYRSPLPIHLCSICAMAAVRALAACQSPLCYIRHYRAA